MEVINVIQIMFDTYDVKTLKELYDKNVSLNFYGYTFEWSFSKDSIEILNDIAPTLGIIKVLDFGVNYPDYRLVFVYGEKSVINARQCYYESNYDAAKNGYNERICKYQKMLQEKADFYSKLSTNIESKKINE